MRLAQARFCLGDRRIALGLDGCRMNSVRWRCCGLLRVTQGDGVRAFFGEWAYALDRIFTQRQFRPETL